MTFVGAPPVVETADELLPAARQLIDRETEALEADVGVVVSCGPGCNACCEHAVVVTAAEHRAIADAVAELPVTIQQRIADRARQVLEHVAANIAGDVAAIVDFDPDFSRQYYAMAQPCPLLIDGACIVRAVRPLVCREYLMSSPPEHCADRSLEHVVRIRRRRKVAAGFRHVSARFDDATPLLLPIALLQSAEAAHTAPMSGPKLARLLLTTR